MGQELVKDKKALHDAARRACGGLDWAQTLGSDRADLILGGLMDGKSRFILAAIMSSMMVFMVTLLVTYLNLGLRPDFLKQWAKAYIIAWPVAATTGFLIMPAARRMTNALVARMEKAA